jgi:hypothetical protein
MPKITGKCDEKSYRGYTVYKDTVSRICAHYNMSPYSQGYGDHILNGVRNYKQAKRVIDHLIEIQSQEYLNNYIKSLE